MSKPTMEEIEDFIKMARIGDNWALTTLLNKYHTDIIDEKAGGRTALMEAAWTGHPNTVKLLLNWGADTTIKSADGWTALEFTNCCETIAVFENWKQRLRRDDEEQLAKGFDEITKTIMGGLKVDIPYKGPAKLPPSRKTSP